jgi:2-polyprenyl-3-methyl-5-hydroxy-6-metoxy-1,4-benzoquinol methylase
MFMSNVNLEKCPLCGSLKIKFKFSCKDYFVSGEEFDMYSCLQCEFLFTNNFPANNSIEKYYNTPEYVSHSNTKKGLINKLYHPVRKYMLNKKMKLICKHSGKQTGRILDVGCATGYFLDIAKRNGWETVGTEKNEYALNIAKEQFGLYVKPEEHIYKFPKDSFDVITLWHVLEHLEYLNEIMEKIYSLIVSDGIVVIAVPNYSSYDARHYKKYWAGYDTPRHLWHFTPKTMELLAKKFNFRITYKKPMMFDSFYVSLLSEKYKGHNIVIALAKAFVIGCISNIKTWSKKGKNKGSAMIYVLKKNQ